MTPHPISDAPPPTSQHRWNEYSKVKVVKIPNWPYYNRLQKRMKKINLTLKQVTKSQLPSTANSTKQEKKKTIHILIN